MARSAAACEMHTPKAPFVVCVSYGAARKTCYEGGDRPSRFGSLLFSMQDVKLFQNLSDAVAPCIIEHLRRERFLQQ